MKARYFETTKGKVTVTMTADSARVIADWLGKSLNTKGGHFEALKVALEKALW